MNPTEYVPDSQVLDNQARAKALGIDIPGLKTTPATAGTQALAPEPTMASAGFVMPAITVQSEADKLQEQLYGDVSETEDVADIRSRYISMFQDQVNALNQVYDQQLSRAQAQGVGRVGQGTAILARRGLAGSPRGGAIQEGVLDQNRQIEGAIQAERNAAVQQVYGYATQLAVQEASERRAAKERGTQDYIDYLRTQEERKATNTSAIVQALIAQGIDPATMTPQDLQRVAKELKITPEQLIGSYKTEKAAVDATTAEKEREMMLEDQEAALEQRKVDIDEAYKNGSLSIEERQLALDQLKADRDYQATLDEKAGVTPEAINAGQDTINSIQSVIDNAGLSSAVGPNKAARMSAFEKVNNKRGSAVASIQQLASQLTLDKLIQAKAAGATFGALSDGERQVLSESASKINNWAITDGTGKVIGYDATEKQVKDELEKIKGLAERDQQIRREKLISDSERAELDSELGDFDAGSYFNE